MAIERRPSYVQAHKLSGGRLSYYWVRPKWAAPPVVRNGRTCPLVSTSLGPDKWEAFKRADALNAAFAEWRKGTDSRLAHGSVRWLFAWYRDDARFTSKRHKTRTGYREAMDAAEEIAMRVGTLGERQARAIDATAADKLYQRARDKHGERQGAYMMQVCRLVWNQAVRHAKVTGIKENPFSGMGIKSSGGGQGNRAATRAEYDAYKAAARAMGRQSMATAAALCFECCQRVWDAFGFEDPDRRVVRGITWEGYRPGIDLRLVQSKTGNPVVIPLVDRVDGEDVPLYPELEAELALLTRREDGGLIVRDERTGEPYTTSYMTKLHRRIRDKAGLDKDIRFTSFRHGGITEIGDSGTDDVRAVSGHSTLDVTRIYNKANAQKARQIAAVRRQHIEMLGAVVDEGREAA